jgi:hypothetical protein
MSEVLGRLSEWAGTRMADLETLGGEDLILAERREILTDPRNSAVVAALCSQWDDLSHRDEVAGYLIESVRSSNPMTLVDVLDVILDSPRPLYDVAKPLAAVLSELSHHETILGAVALEGWTRLALGNWCPSLQLRAELVTRVQAAGAEADGIFLVRAIGAALERWGDQELLAALTILASHDEINDDVAYEIGMYHLNVALSSTKREAAVAGLHEALRWLRQAGASDGRSDALTFTVAVEQVVRFVAGESITGQAVDAVRDAVLSYLQGYMNETRHWRQPRADTAACWAELTQALYEVADLRSSAWWEPGKLLAATARVLDGHRSLVLLADPDIALQADSSGAADVDDLAAPTAARAVRQAGLELLLRPPVQAALGSRNENVGLIDRWLEQAEEDSNAGSDVKAVRDVREALRREAGTGPKGPQPSVPALRRLLKLDTDDLGPLSALADHPAILEQLEARAVLAEEQPGPTVAENVALDKLLPVLRKVPGYSDAAPSVDWMIQQLLRFVMRYIDKQSGGKRSEPWQMPFESRNAAPTEDTLADSFARWLMATTGVRAHVEVSDIGGGRVDVVVFLTQLRLVVEVKREFSNKSQDELVDAYGMQSVQYNSADVPFAFLAILDLARWDVRSDIQACLWARHVALPESGSRIYGLTTARVQANVAPPSTSSWARRSERANGGVLSH